MQEIPAELHIDILRKLPIASCIVRLRCVCKSWDALLSDPSFTSQNLFSAAEKQERNSDSPPVTMIVRYDENNYRSVYSLHSCDTIESLLIPGGEAAAAEFPFNLWSVRIKGCCDGILCLSERKGRSPREDLILWNPTTSETKLLPPSLLKVSFRRYWVSYNTAGFGFDPETNDYKVVRLITLCDFNSGVFKGHFMEVYSLRNDAWRKCDIVDFDCSIVPKSSYWDVAQYRKGKVYWRCSEMCSCTNTLFMWFDLSKEVLQGVKVTNPPEGRIIESISKPFNQDESLIAICSGNEGTASWEIWALLKFRVSESWTKLFTFPIPENNLYGFKKVSGNYKFLFSQYYPDDDDIGLTLACYHLKTGEINNRFKLFPESVSNILVSGIINYVPSQVSLCNTTRKRYASSCG